MTLTPSAHVDTFCRDHLPPADQWPDLEFTLPELAYPDRLNCARSAAGGDDRRRTAPTGRACCRRTRQAQVWSYGDLARTASQIAHVLTDDLGARAGQPGAAARAEQPVAGRLLVRRAAGWRRRGRHDAAAALGRADDHLRHRAGATSRCVTTGSPTNSPAADAPGLRIVSFDSAAPGSRPARCEASPTGNLNELASRKPDTFAAVETAADDVALIAFTSGTTGRPKAAMHFHRDVLATADTFSALRAQADPGRHLHRHAAAGVHVRARRDADLPDPGWGGDAADRAGDPGRARRSDRGPRRHGGLDRADRLPGDARRREGRPAARAAPAGLGGRDAARLGLAGVLRRDRRQDHRRDRQHGAAAHLHLRRR